MTLKVAMKAVHRRMSGTRQTTFSLEISDMFASC
jgi:hypothetical protein